MSEEDDQEELLEITKRLRRVFNGEDLLNIYPECRNKPKCYGAEWTEWKAREQAEVWKITDLENYFLLSN